MTDAALVLVAASFPRLELLQAFEPPSPSPPSLPSLPSPTLQASFRIAHPAALQRWLPLLPACASSSCSLSSCPSLLLLPSLSCSSCHSLPVHGAAVTRPRTGPAQDGPSMLRAERGRWGLTTVVLILLITRSSFAADGGVHGDHGRGPGALRGGAADPPTPLARGRRRPAEAQRHELPAPDQQDPPGPSPTPCPRNVPSCMHWPCSRLLLVAALQSLAPGSRPPQTTVTLHAQLRSLM